jgi:succinylglutamate desuccinylase
MDDHHSLEGQYVLVAVFFLLQLQSDGEQIFEDGLCHLDVRVDLHTASNNEGLYVFGAIN